MERRRGERGREVESGEKGAEGWRGGETKREGEEGEGWRGDTGELNQGLSVISSE